MSMHPKHESGSKCEGCNSRLKDGHQEIVKFFESAKSLYPEIHCSWVYRGKEDQEAAFNSGASRAHFGQSKHNLMPSQAIDIFTINSNGKAVFDGVFCARLNKKMNELGFKLKWGGEFKSIGDSGHFELKN